MPELSFVVNADYKNLVEMTKRLSELRTELLNLDKNADPARVAQLQEQIKGLNQQVRTQVTQLPKVATSYLDIQRSFSQLNAAAKINKEAIGKLQAEYDTLGKMAGEAFSKGDDKSYRAIEQRQRAINNEVAARKSLISEIGRTAKELDTAAGAYEKESQKAQQSVNMRQRMFELQRQMEAVRERTGTDQSEEYRKLANEYGRLRDIRGDIQRQGAILSDDNANITGIISGMQGVTGAFTMAQGAAGLLATKNEELQKVMLKVQSLMSITMGLQQVANTLNKDSAFRLVILAKAKNAYSAATLFAGKALVKFGLSANAARIAASALMATLTLGLGVAITAVVSLISKLNSKNEEMAEKQKAAAEAAKEARKVYDNYYTNTGRNAAALVSKYKELQDQYKKLSSEHEKQEWIKKNADGFNELSLKVNSVNDADDVLIRKTDAVVESLTLRAEAMALQEMKKDAYSKYFDKLLADRNKYNQTHLNDEYDKGVIGKSYSYNQIPQWIKDAGVKEKDLKVTETIEQWAGADGKMHNSIKKTYEITKEAYDKAIAYRKEYGQNAINAEKARAEEELNQILDFVTEQSKDVQEKINKNGVLVDDPENDEAKKKAEEERKKAEEAQKKAAELAKKKAAERAKITLEAAKEEEGASLTQRERSLKEQEERLAMSQDGFNKELEQLRLNHEKRILEIDREEQAMVERLREKAQKEWEAEHPEATEQAKAEHRTSLMTVGSANYIGKGNVNGDDAQYLETQRNIANAAEEKAQEKLYKNLLDKYRSYEQQRADINAQFDAQRAAILGNEKLSEEEKNAYLVELEKQRAEQIKSINNEEVEALKKSSPFLITLFSDMESMSTKSMSKVMNDVKRLLDYLKNTDVKDIEAMPEFGFTKEQLVNLKGSPKDIEALTERYTKLKETVEKSNPFKALGAAIKDVFEPKKNEKGEEEDLEPRMKRLGNAVAGTADIAGDFAGQMKEMFEAMGNDQAAAAMETVQNTMGAVSSIGKAFAQGGLVGGIIAAAGEAMNFVTRLVSANAQYHAELRKYREEQLAFANTYRLALLKEAAAAEHLSTIFGDLDYAKAVNSITVANEAAAELAKTLAGDGKGWGASSLWENAMAKKFGKSAKALNNELKKQYSGLAQILVKTGVERYGFFNMKTRDVYGSILDEYPELIDASGKFNITLAETILNTRTMKEEGKTALTTLIDLAKQAEEAAAQMKEYLAGIFGDFGNSISDALVDAFKNGTDAAQAFKDSVASMIEKLAKDMILSTLFSKMFQDAQERLEAIYNDDYSGKGGEQKRIEDMVDVVGQLAADAYAQQENANDLMEAVKQAAARNGINAFQAEKTSQSATVASVQSITEDSAEELIGRVTAMYESMLRTEAAEDRRETLANTMATRLDTLDNHTMEIRNVADGIRDTIERGYLEWVAIRENTGAIIAPIRQMQQDIAKVKENTSRL